MDEAHSSFLSDEFRPKMQGLAHLQQATVPKIYLTATLAPDHEKILADYVGITLTRALVLRSPTARPNHQLEVAKVPDSKSPLSVALQLASGLLQTWTDDPAVRGIIFVRSVAKLEMTFKSSPFHTCIYHGKMTDEQKDRQLDDWLSDRNDAKWMISTTALLHGVDYPRVDAVIFAESPFGLYDFVQGAGRAGRSGQGSLVAVLYNRLPSEMPGENPHGYRQKMGHVLENRLCRRVGISKVMDGEGRSCSELTGSLLCDVCHGRLSGLVTAAIDTAPTSPTQTDDASNDFTPQPPPKPTSGVLLRGLVAQEGADARKEHAQSVKKAMELFGGCFVCRIWSDDHSPCHRECGDSGTSGCSKNPHRPYTCTSFGYKNGWMDWKKQHIRWPGGVSRCYFCGLPNAVNGTAHQQDCPGRCKFSDTAITAAWHILNTPEVLEDLKRELGFRPDGDLHGSFGKWLSEYELASKEVRLLSVFLWLCSRYYPDKACGSCFTFGCTEHTTVM